MDNNPSQENDNSINVTKDYLSEYEPISKNAFAQFIKERRIEYNEDNGAEISTRDLGMMIGIDYEMFRKILNQEKPTKKRDCIIAICVALNLLPGQIDEALGLYQYMPALDKDNPREKFILAQLSHGSHLTVNELNERLIRHNFPGLDIHDKRDGKKKSEQKDIVNLKYKVLELKVRTPVDFEHYYGDLYNSLCTTYDPSRCNITGDMLLLDIENKQYFHLTADTKGNRNVKQLTKKQYKRLSGSVKSIFGKSFDSLEETGDYKNYFIELENAINLEKRSHLGILNDTKYYHSRSSAKLIDDVITIFMEQFNYSIPELNEYYLMTRSSDQYKLLVYERSSFMAWYLSAEKYKGYFETDVPAPKETYASLEEIQELVDKTGKNDDERIRYKMRLYAFKRLKPGVDELYQELKDRKVFIQNLKNIYDNPAEVLSYFKLESDFECEYDDSGEICYGTDSKEYLLPDGTNISISLDDIERAFEFDFSDIQEICRIKAKYGSIEAVL